jgi:hypothetical protein
MYSTVAVVVWGYTACGGVLTGTFDWQRGAGLMICLPAACCIGRCQATRKHTLSLLPSPPLPVSHQLNSNYCTRGLASLVFSLRS